MVKKIFAQAYLWILLLLLYSPIVIIVIYSFTEAKSAGQLDRFLYQTLYFAFHYGHASFFDECID